MARTGKCRSYKYQLIAKNIGLCIASSANAFLGDYGAISKDNAKQVFPIIEKSVSNLTKNESDRILEALIKIV